MPTIRSRGFKFLSVLGALLIGIGLIALAGSVMLPSTKRARIDWEEVHRLRAQEEADSAAATQATTQPASATTSH